MRSMKTTRRRSLCPISSSLEIVGDRWSLLVIRDLMLRGPLTYGQLLESDEGIATNILADRLAKLTDAGLLEKREADVRSGFVYALTEKGLDLMPVLFELRKWGEKYCDGSVAAIDLGRISPADLEQLEAQMRARHVPSE
jgi:DNA-binding HxlR family transcriptional regulator